MEVMKKIEYQKYRNIKIYKLEDHFKSIFKI